MKMLALLLAGLAAGGVRTQLTYTAVRGSETRMHRLSFDGSNPGSDYRLPFEGLERPLQNLPLWLPMELRAPGAVIYDDGEGFKNDKGRETYILSSLSKGKTSPVVGLHYAYQGMQESDQWILEAQYDTASGYLLSATVRTRSAGSSRVVCELTLTAKQLPPAT